MRAFITRRVSLAVIQLVIVATLVFLLIRMIPGDAARAVLGDNATEEQVAEIRSRMGLDEPIAIQYLRFWFNLFRGDLGNSLISGRPVTADLFIRLSNSLELVIAATALAVIIGLILGRAAALRADRLFDHSLTGGSVLGISLPVFVTGTVLLLVFSIWIPILPPQRYAGFFDQPVTHIQLVLLPVLTLTATSAAVVTRMTRSAILEVQEADFVRTVRAKGVVERRVINSHILRNSLVPVVSVTSIEMATLIGSTVLVETIFGWPGMSSMLMQAVSNRDYPVIQAVVLAAATFVICVNLISDVVIRVLDPRTEAI